MDDYQGVDVQQGSPFVPQAIKSIKAGPRPSIAPLLELVDTTEPAFQFIAAELKDMADAGVELDATAVAIAVKLGRQRYSNEARKRHAVPERRSIVYYVSRGELVKIGTTSNPLVRFKTQMPDEVLAFEPGGTDEEASRHRQFSGCRVARKGEYFRRTDILMEHIAAMRLKYGAPDAAWPSVATLGKGYARTRVGVALPEPTSGEVATATEAAKLLGMSRSTIQGWAHRGLITPVSRSAKGCPEYYMDHMRFLIQRNREWMNRGSKDGSS